jgi:hypothetical protein
MLGVDTLSFHVSFLSLMWKLCLLVDFYEFYAGVEPEKKKLGCANCKKRNFDWAN